MATKSLREDVKNVIGACIFIAYVLTALFLTVFLIHDLFTKYHSIPLPHKKSLSAKVQTCAALSSISFSILSYNMLNFLILSYRDWALSHSLPFPTASSRIAFWSHLHIWSWLRTSTLFRDFAQTIVASKERFWGTGQGLLWTMGWSAFMSVEGECPTVHHFWCHC